MHQYLIKQLGLGHTLAIYIVAIILAIATAIQIDIVKRINYAIDYELGVSHLCDGTDTAYGIGCKYDYSDLLNR